MIKKGLFRITLIFFVFVAVGFNSYAQRISLKTNTIEWAIMTPNIGLELTFSKLVSLDIQAAYSPFEFNKFSTKHVTFTPEVRFWLNTPSIAHAIGGAATISYGHLLIGKNDIEGLVAGVGPTYTYAYILSDHWNFELTGGLGCFYYKTIDNKSGWLPGPIKFGATFVYILR